MKHIKFLLVILFIFIFSASYSYKVDVTELRESKKIEFINYAGRHAAVYSPSQRRGIGRSLAEISDRNNQFYSYLSYSIIHAVDKNDTNGMDADIFSILRGAKIDHINSIRLILSSYLSSRYGYSSKNAETIAVFITYYNAVHRGDTAYFGDKYKKIVLNNISGDNAGISTLYSDWPGRTKMLIPLTDDLKRGDAGLLDTSEISGKEVVDELKNKEDKGVKERKEITEIKKKEIEESGKNIEEKKKEIAEKSAEIEKKEKQTEVKKSELEKTKKELTEKEKELEKEKESAKNIKDKDEKAKKESEIAQKEKELEKGKKEAQNKETRIKKEEKETAQNKETLKKEEVKVNKEEQKTAKKEEEVKKETAEIKKDEKSVITEKSPEELKKKSAELNQKELELTKREEELKKSKPDRNIFEGKLYYLKIIQYLPEGHYNNNLMTINPITKTVDLTSPFKDICGHKFDVFKDGVVVIGYSSDNHAADHFLVLLDSKTLELKDQGKDNIFWRSFVEIREDFIYAIILSKDVYYLGKFNEKLEKVAQSAEPLDPDTFISFYSDFIYVNGKDKKILVLNKGDLSKNDIINP